MACNPTSELTLRELSKLRDTAKRRGDDCLALILSGVELHVSLGKELELLEHMRDFVHEIREAVEGTPSAADLERLYRAADDAQT